MWSKIATFMIFVTASSLLLTPLELEARGGGGGGGRGGGGGGRGGSVGGGNRGGGGAYRGGHTMNRTPSMSRASNRPSTSQPRQQIQSRPSTSQARQQIQTRPAASQGKIQQSRQTTQQRPSSANRAELRNQVNRYAQSKPAQKIDTQSLKQKGQNFSSKRDDQIRQNRQLSDKVSHRLQQSRPNYDHWFDRDFFDRHDIDLDYVGTGINWWRPATWATLAMWGSWHWSTPYYYDDAGYAYPLTTSEYTSAAPYSTPVTTEMQTPQTDVSISTEEEWLPLGVFAVANNADEAPYTNRFIQLAINRNGEIAGVLYNSTTDTAQDLTGMVDPTSQQAYWSMADQTDSPIASTGIYNLTEDQTPINVHFTDGSEQTWTLVRLQQE